MMTLCMHSSALHIAEETDKWRAFTFILCGLVSSAAVGVPLGLKVNRRVPTRHWSVEQVDLITSWVIRAQLATYRKSFSLFVHRVSEPDDTLYMRIIIAPPVGEEKSLSSVVITRAWFQIRCRFGWTLHPVKWSLDIVTSTLSASCAGDVAIARPPMKDEAHRNPSSMFLYAPSSLAYIHVSVPCWPICKFLIQDLEQRNLQSPIVARQEYYETPANLFCTVID